MEGVWVIRGSIFRWLILTWFKSSSKVYMFPLFLSTLLTAAFYPKQSIYVFFVFNLMYCYQYWNEPFLQALFRKIAAALPGMENLSSTKQEDMVDVNLRSTSGTASQSQPQSGGCACWWIHVLSFTHHTPSHSLLHLVIFTLCDM